MKKWIGTYNQKTITGLFNSDAIRQVALQHDIALNDGDLVTVTEREANAELVTESTRASDAEVETAWLASAASPELKVYQVLAEKGLDPHHPPQCEQEAHRWLLNPGHDSDNLHDLTYLPFVTIDNADSRDLDQALYIDSDNNDNLHVYYALADASYYVRPGSAIFNEAVRRAVTYYVPGLSVPMLPRALSEDLVSLNPDVVRRALLFKMTVDANGEATDTVVSRALIKSQAKLAYDKVQELYDSHINNKKHPYQEATYGQSLLNLQRVGRRRILHAQRRDVVDYNRSEPGVRISDTGFTIQLRQRCDCEKYNEQVSLLCNMEGARLLEQLQHKSTGGSELQSIFRVHSPPLKQRLAELRQSLNELCDAHELDNIWRWQPDQPLADYLSALPTQGNASSADQPGAATQVVVGKNGSPNRVAIKIAIERMILLTNRASFFTDEPGPHHALGVQSYARFSSPMREIAGIFTHKELLEALNLEDAHQTEHDEQLQDLIVTAANASKRLQKELDHEFHLLAIENYLHLDLQRPLEERPVRAATIMGMRAGKIYVSIDGFGSDVKLYLDDLGRQFNTRYQVHGVIAAPVVDSKANTEADNATVAPLFKIGDRLRLQLTHHDPGNRRFVLAPLWPDQTPGENPSSV